jgi:uncharacterized protein (DUF1499 family)
VKILSMAIQSGGRIQSFNANNCVSQKLSSNWNLTPIKYKSYRPG